MIWAITTSIKLDSCGNKWKMNEIISIEISQKQNIEYKRNRTQTKWQHFYNDHTHAKLKLKNILFRKCICCKIMHTHMTIATY